jgi:hypothetical protein
MPISRQRGEDNMEETHIMAKKIIEKAMNDLVELRDNPNREDRLKDIVKLTENNKFLNGTISHLNVQLKCYLEGMKRYEL